MTVDKYQHSLFAANDHRDSVAISRLDEYYVQDSSRARLVSRGSQNRIEFGRGRYTNWICVLVEGHEGVHDEG